MGTSMRQFASEYASSMLTPKKAKISKRNKYGARKTIAGHNTFDSKIEADFYLRLEALKRAGKIIDIQLQYEFILQEEFFDNNKTKHRSIKYYADFRVIFNDGTEKIYDTKGTKTKEYAIKKKLLLYKFKEITFEEVYSAQEHKI